MLGLFNVEDKHGNGGGQMSAYSDYKAGCITWDEYKAICWAEAAADNDFDESEVFIDDEIDEF